MALMPRGEPRSVPDPLSDEWDRAAELNRRLQARNLGLAPGRSPSRSTTLERRLRDAEVDNAAWQRLRSAHVRGEGPTRAEVSVSAPPKAKRPRKAAGEIDTYVPYGPITLDDILVAGAKAGELGGERIRRRLPEGQEQLWTGRGLFTDYEGRIRSGAPTRVAGGYDAIIHTHPPNWSDGYPGDGDWGHKTPVYGIVGARVWKIPPGSDAFYWLK